MKKRYRIVLVSLAAAMSLTASAWEATSLRLATAQTTEHQLLKIENFKSDAPSAKTPSHVSAYAPTTTPTGNKQNLAFTAVGVSATGQELVDGYAVDMYVDGSDVYIRNLVYYGNDNSYCKGTLEGDLTNGVITFENGIEYANGNYAYIGGMDASGEWLVPDKNVDTFSYTIHNGVITLDATGTTGQHAYLLGVDEYDSIIGYTINNTYNKMSPLVNPIIPQDCTMELYRGSSTSYDKVPGFEFSCKVGITGDDVYITSLSTAAPEIVLHGTLTEDNKIVFETGWFGIYRNTYIQLLGCRVAYDDNNSPVLGPTTLSQITFDYDPDDKSLIANESFDSFAIIAGAQTMLSYYLEPNFYYISDEITSKPENAIGQLYLVQKDAISFSGEPTYEKSLQTVYSDSDDNYYFTGAYKEDNSVVFKATQNASDRMEIIVPQLIGETKEGKPLYLFEGYMEVNTGVFPPVAYYSKTNNPKTISLYIDRETGTYTIDGTICAGTLEASTISIDNGYSNSTWSPNSNLTENTLPEGIEMKSWYLSSTANYSHVRMHNIQTFEVLVGNVGNEWYIQGIDVDDSKAAILKGYMNDNKLVIPTPQFFSEKNSITMAYAGEFNSSDDYDVLDADQFVFTYDPDTHKLSSDGMLIMRNLLDEDMYYFYEPVITENIVNENAVPKNPMPVSGEEYSDRAWETLGVVYTAWEIFPESTDGNQLNEEDVFYSVFVDGELFKFTPRDYRALCEECGGETTIVPLSFRGELIDPYRNERRINLVVMPKQSIGVQTVYICGDNETRSEVVTYNILTHETTIGGTSGIGNVNQDMEALSTTWYDLTGRAVPDSYKGICIKVTKYTDETTTVQKVVR